MEKTRQARSNYFRLDFWIDVIKCKRELTNIVGRILKDHSHSDGKAKLHFILLGESQEKDEVKISSSYHD